MDMALLVESQGELIHQIEYNGMTPIVHVRLIYIVVSAVEYTAKAEQELIKAVKLQSSARKKVLSLSFPSVGSHARLGLLYCDYLTHCFGCDFGSCAYYAIG